jgi:hypothetical protein
MQLRGVHEMKTIVFGLVLSLSLLFCLIVALVQSWRDRAKRLTDNDEDAHLRTVAEHSYRTGKACVGSVDENGHLAIREIDSK